MIRLLVIFLMLAGGVHAMSPEQVERSLSENQGLVLRSRQPISGKAVSIVDGQLLFRARRGGGSLEYRYPLQDIERLQFPGNDVAYAAREYIEADEPKKALPLMEAMFLQRGPYLQLITPGEMAFFAEYAELEYHHGDPFKGLGAGKALLDYAQDPRLKRQLEDLVLLGNYQLPIEQNTRDLAEEWVAENEPYGPSALGYYVLGRLDFDNEDYDEALMQALEPVVYSSQFPMAYLDYCYALAIAACVELELVDEERKLRAEMAERHIAWPDIDDLALYRQPTQPSTDTPES